MKKIAIVNQKGGVGKTTTTVNLGAALVNRGYKVLLVDFDPQANTTTHLGYAELSCRKGDDAEDDYIYYEDHLSVNGALDDLLKHKDYEGTLRNAVLHHEEGIDLIPCNIELAALEYPIQSSVASERKLEKLLNIFDNEYDYCLIDCQPSLNVLPLNAMTAADLLLIPVATQGLAVKGLTDLLITATGVKAELNSELDVLGILFTFAESHTNQTKDAIEGVSAAYKDDLPIFKSVIPKAVIGGETAMTGHSLFYKHGSCPLAQRYQELADEVIDATKGDN